MNAESGAAVAETVQQDTGREVDSLAGKYMTFKLAEEEYGLEILKVREIIGLMSITSVPRTAQYICGVINLRGKVIPVVDLRLKFEMESAETTDQSVIIVVQYKVEEQTVVMGILIDEVVEVLDIPSSQIEPPPSFGGKTNPTDFILGVGKSDDRVIFLLDIGKVLREENTLALGRVESAA